MARRLAAIVLLSFTSIACALVPAGSPSPRPPVPTNSPAPSPSGQPTQPAASPTTAPTVEPSGSPSGLYLRGWYSQAIPPQYTFAWLPPVTIAAGEYINGNVAVPAIYPGPLMIMPVARRITTAGTDKIVAEARRLGLLEGSGDFTGGTPMPGAKLVHVEIKTDGTTYELSGNPDPAIECIKAPCEGAPGSPQAFTSFWQDLLSLDTWLADELGPSAQYAPERVALMLTKSADPATLSPAPTLVDWPLSSGPQEGCQTLAGDDLTTLLPTLVSATQLTAFSHGKDVYVPLARVLVPGEPSPCG